jgi:hypothetical protein
MKEVYNNKEFLDLRKFDNPINSIELIKSITSNKVSDVFFLNSNISLTTEILIQVLSFKEYRK